MKLQVRGQQIDWTGPLRRLAKWRLSVALSRFGHSVCLVAVDIRSYLGATGDFQKPYRITGHQQPKRSSLLRDAPERPYTALGELVDEAARAVVSLLERERDGAPYPAHAEAGEVSKL